MRINGHNGLVLFLIGCGSLILLDKIGFSLGHLMGFIIPIAMMVLGYMGIKNAKKFLGWAIFIMGLMILLGKFSGLFGFIIAAGLIIYGFSLLRKKSNAY